MIKTTPTRAIIGAGLLISSSLAFADGRLEGRVVAGDKSTFLEGARIYIEALDRSVATARDGRFSFGQVPAGSYSVTVEYLGAPSETASITVEDGATARLNVTVGVELTKSSYAARAAARQAH